MSQIIQRMRAAACGSVEWRVQTPDLQTIFSGGCSDSLNPRKAHLLDPATGGALCGQSFRAWQNVEISDIGAADYWGNEACAKCLRKMDSLINRLPTSPIGDRKSVVGCVRADAAESQKEVCDRGERLNGLPDGGA
jgi:hypothetical protein